MKNLFFETYPYSFPTKKLPRISLLVFLAIFIIVYIFRPFNVNFSEHKFNYLTLCIIQAATGGFSFFLYFNIFNFFSRKWRLKNDWNLFKETVTVFFAASFMGIGAFLIRNIIYDNPYNFSLKYFIEEIFHAWLIGGVFYLFYTVVNYYRFSNLEIKETKLANEAHHKVRTDIVNTVPIKTHVKSDKFDLDLNKFLIAKADGNYVEIYSENKDEIDKNLVRLSLKDLEKQLKPHKFITRTHRTFLVNTKKVANVSGNASGYELEFDKLDFLVPVSRGNIKNFDLTMNQK